MLSSSSVEEPHQSVMFGPKSTPPAMAWLGMSAFTGQSLIAHVQHIVWQTLQI